MSFLVIFVVSCGQSEAPSGNDVTFDVIGVQLYNEFIPCVGGSDFNQENVDKIMKDREIKQNEFSRLSSMTIETMWNEELDNLDKYYRIYQKERAASMLEKAIKKKFKKKKGT